MKKLIRKITGWLIKKTDYELALPVQTINIQPQNFKRFHSQHLIDWFEWQNTPFTTDFFMDGFKRQIINELIKEIVIKTEETPEGICYSCDLLFRNI